MSPVYSPLSPIAQLGKLVWLAFIALFVMLSSTACTTIELKERDFIPKDNKLANHQLVSGYRLENIEIVQADGAISKGVWLKKPHAEFTILYWLGGGMKVDEAGALIAENFEFLNANVVMLDYRGFGRSLLPTQANRPAPRLLDLHVDALVIYDYLRQKVQGKLVVHGYSFGSFVASRLASERALDGLVLQGTTTTPDAYARGMIPWYIKLFVKIKLDEGLQSIDNRAALQSYRGPILIMNGTHDVQTLHDDAKALYEALPATISIKQFVSVPGAGHGDALAHASAKEAYISWWNQIKAARMDSVCTFECKGE